ncbi:hypothetical protein LMH87_006907 [Akanthomyces muscarius]|uniref:Uncharacterized protein n=1 Tax=Akanthomyces muscarius TaxID=2231603 RepID=A0A9W8QP76_AKAMU|nr:hypothetical protein LMH87_006907 [Akanthomyces muscarius]KAJ4165269.1 hypothetical protein LMH87_006907 [Akanthomyces muscarius]
MNPYWCPRFLPILSHHFVRCRIPPQRARHSALTASRNAILRDCPLSLYAASTPSYRNPDHTVLNEALILVNNGFCFPEFHPFFDPDYMALCSSLRDSMSHDLQAPAEPLASLQYPFNL